MSNNPGDVLSAVGSKLGACLQQAGVGKKSARFDLDQNTTHTIPARVGRTNVLQCIPQRRSFDFNFPATIRPVEEVSRDFRPNPNSQEEKRNDDETAYPADAEIKKCNGYTKITLKKNECDYFIFRFEKRSSALLSSEGTTATSSSINPRQEAKCSNGESNNDDALTKESDLHPSTDDSHLCATDKAADTIIKEEPQNNDCPAVGQTHLEKACMNKVLEKVDDLSLID